MSRSLHPLLLAVAASTLATSAGAAPLPIAVTVGLRGELTSLDCAAPTVPLFVRVAGELAGEPEALAIDAGGLLGASAVTRLAIAADVDRLAGAVVAAGFRALVVGRSDLAAPRAQLLRAARALRVQGVQFVASNLRCQGAAGELCAALVAAEAPPLSLSTSGGRVAIVSALHPSVLGQVARDRADGLTLAPPAVALADAVRRARAGGAARVVAVYQPQSGEELSDGLAVARALKGAAAPDLMILNGVTQLISSARAAGSAVPITATTPGHAIVVDDLAIGQAREPRAATPAALVRSYSRELGAELCRSESAALAGGQLTSPLTSDDFVALTLDVIREIEGAEVAVVNRGAFVDRQLFPLRGALTRLQIEAALPFDNRLRHARVPGEVLRRLLAPGRDARLYHRGLTRDDKELRVNGRRLVDAMLYDVVTTDFVAENGDGGIGQPGDDPLVWKPLGEATMRELMLAWLVLPRRGDAREDVIDPAMRTRWSFRVSADVKVDTALIRNPNKEALDDAQLSRSQALVIAAEAETRADADHPDYTFENRLRLQYGALANLGTDDSSLRENLDLITGRSTLTYRGWNRGARRRYVPLLYGELFGESEINQAPSLRGYHHLLVRPMAGTRFQLGDRFAIYAGLGAEWEALARLDQLTPQTSNPVFSVAGGWILRPGTLFKIGDRQVEAESTLEVTGREVNARPQALIRFSARLTVPLFDPLAFTIAYDLFAREVPVADEQGRFRATWGVANDLSVGLRLLFRRSVQSFRH